MLTRLPVLLLLCAIGVSAFAPWKWDFACPFGKRAGRD